MGRNWPPLTLMTVLGPPAVTSRERNALTGVGVGHGAELAGTQAALAMGAWATRRAAEAAAATTRTAGARRRIPGERMKRGNDSRVGFVTPVATGSTTPSLARGSASVSPGLLAAGV